jgi:enamine deaminase RidA (YjgF/YER057c/UK114 family)
VSIAANHLAEAASDALRRGRAVGMGSLPRGISVEIEAILAVKG